MPTVADVLAADAGGACSEPRIAILADEAHRSHGHGMTATLHRLLCGGKAQPRRVAYVSFSATPSEVALALFGTEDHTSGRREPFSCYPLHEALREQMCVDVLSRYTCKRGDVALYDRLGRSTAIDDVLRDEPDGAPPRAPPTKFVREGGGRSLWSARSTMRRQEASRRRRR